MSIIVNSTATVEQDVRNPSYHIFNGNDLIAGTVDAGFTTTGNVFGNSITYATATATGLSANRSLLASNNSPVSIGQAKGGINWAKGVKLTTYVCRDSTALDSGVTFRLSFPKVSATSTGDLAIKGIGWKVSGTGFIQIQAHNGTTLTTQNTTATLSDANSHLISVESNGSGTVYLYFDGVLVGQSTGAPTVATGSTVQNVLMFEATTTSATTTTSSLFIGQVHLQTDI